MSANDLSPHPVHEETGIDQFDVFIAGSGPLGATYARLLVDKGFSVVMVEIGDQDTRIPGAHKKNEIEYQKDIDRFVRFVATSQAGALSTVSIPTSSTIMPTLDPSAWTASDPGKMMIFNGRNPYQEEYNNLGAEAVTRGVGGMSTHWTCATPEFLKGVERPKIFSDQDQDDAEWNTLYEAARTLIGTSEHEFDHSIRHNVVLKALQDAYPDRVVKSLPLACHRLAPGSPYVQWHAADNVFGDMFTNPDKTNAEGIVRGCFRLITNTRCTRLLTGTTGNTNVEINIAEVQDLLAARFDGTSDPQQTNFAISAKVTLTALQILANSNFGGFRDQPDSEMLIPNLGKRITEQPMTFCQIVLRKVDDVGELADKPQWWKDAVDAHVTAHPNDPLPIPFQDPEPQVTIPATEERPWHTQIHRDAFSYGEAGPKVDPRVVVDLRFFGMQAGEPDNRLLFEGSVKDAYGMPQPTFEYKPSDGYALEATRMMNEFVLSRGNCLDDDSYPQFMTPGLALHLGGTVRLGQENERDVSVADYNSQVWDFTNLFVAGNGTIPTPFGTNPTLTSISLALRSVNKISEDLTSSNKRAGGGGAAVKPTSKASLKWAFDKKDPNFPRHDKLRVPHRVVSA
ncbi:putative pyranose oxidase [Amylostereum chailletii]|nr:putative pyranose oxidase [Amylostereum chailletii]